MSVSMSQSIRAYSSGGLRGHIDVTVSVTNNGPGSLLNAPGYLGFYLLDPNGMYRTDFHHIPPAGPDMGGPVEPGGSFDRGRNFDVGPIVFGQQYTLRCVHLLTKEHVENSFEFLPVYLQGQAPTG